MSSLAHAKYRFTRRYLMKFHPDIAKKIYVDYKIEFKNEKEIGELEDKVINWKYNKEEYYEKLGK